jgi:AcrR family transcriptional regulator
MTVPLVKGNPGREGAELAARPQRADARRNRERVLEAAEELFAEEGLNVHVEQVAHRAGVGVGTVCRNFPTKEALIDAVLTVMWESLLAEARAALAADNPGAALKGFLAAKTSVHARSLALVKGMAPGTDPLAGALGVKASLREVFAALVQRAQQAGAVRADVTPGDLAVLCSGISQAIELSAGEADPRLWDRYLTIVMDGLRPGGHTPLPGQARPAAAAGAR